MIRRLDIEAGDPCPECGRTVSGSRSEAVLREVAPTQGTNGRWWREYEVNGFIDIYWHRDQSTCVVWNDRIPVETGPSTMRGPRIRPRINDVPAERTT